MNWVGNMVHCCPDATTDPPPCLIGSSALAFFMAMITTPSSSRLPFSSWSCIPNGKDEPTQRLSQLSFERTFSTFSSLDDEYLIRGLPNNFCNLSFPILGTEK